jgi:drug/metabolite transporter (DMT)-like permease
MLLSPLIWGATFPAGKVVLEELSPWTYMAWSRVLGLASIAALLLVWRTRRDAWTRGLVPAGLLLGVLMSAGYALQTLGLRETTATNTGFITTLYVVFAPLGAALLVRRSPGPAAWLSVALSLAGLALLSLRGTDVQTGDLIVLAGAVAFAAHIVAIDQLVARFHAVALAVAQLVAAAVVQSALAVPAGVHAAAVADLWHLFLLTGVLGSGVAFFIQVVAQARVSPARASVLLASEALFAALVSAIWLGERLSFRAWSGVALMLTAIAVSELHAWRGRRALLDPAA